jgi:hypothetical protein
LLLLARAASKIAFEAAFFITLSAAVLANGVLIPIQIPYMFKVTLAVLITCFLASCKDKPQKVSAPDTTMVSETKISDTVTHISDTITHISDTIISIPDTITDINKVKATDYVFFSDSVLHGHKAVLKYYFNKYGSDSICGPHCEVYDRKDIKDEFEGLLYIGNINNNSTTDSVFVLKPLNYCKLEGEVTSDGQAYYFTDTTLPRLQTDSYCCHPSSLFLVGDIDEDGVSEIGEYHSSCASHYKILHVYSLKNKRWKEIGYCIYDLFYMDIGKPYNYFVRKVSKNKFKMLEITDLTDDSTKIGKRNWKQFSM